MNRIEEEYNERKKEAKEAVRAFIIGTIVFSFISYWIWKGIFWIFNI